MSSNVISREEFPCYLKLDGRQCSWSDFMTMNLGSQSPKVQDQKRAMLRLRSFWNFFRRDHGEMMNDE